MLVRYPVDRLLTSIQFAGIDAGEEARLQLLPAGQRFTVSTQQFNIAMLCLLECAMLYLMH